MVSYNDGCIVIVQFVICHRSLCNKKASKNGCMEFVEVQEVLLIGLMLPAPFHHSLLTVEEGPDAASLFFIMNNIMNCSESSI